jgi:hypothetical protein
MVEIECFGVDYERYALGKLLWRFAKNYNIQSVLEIPAHGEKAMPSIYSLGFGMAGCNVTLINGDESRFWAWKKLKLEDNVEFKKCMNIEQTGLKDNSYDFVWNFAFFPKFQNPKTLLEEMQRVSRKYVAVFSVNGLNIGFPIHRIVHKFTKIPWTHGDIKFNHPGKVKRLFKATGLKNIKIGVVDCPPWPDSLGFRDVRLHRSDRDLSKEDWQSNYISYIQKDQIPLWIKAVYFWERFPMPLVIKFFYSHIFYVLGEKHSG